MITPKEARVVGLTALALFSVCLFEYIYIQHLRAKLWHEPPESWAATPYDGSTNLLLPWTFEDQVHYAAKVNQIRIHGVPYNPFFADQRSLRSAMADGLCFYIIALLSSPFKHLSTAWLYVSYALMVAWLLALYAFFRTHVARHPVRPLLILFVSVLILVTADAWIPLRVDFSIPNAGKLLTALINIDTYKWRGLEFMRLTSPLLTLLLMVPWLGGLIRSLSGRPSAIKGVFVGLSAALFYFVHFYNWTFVLGTLGVLAAASLVVPHFHQDRRVVWPAFLMMIVGMAPWIYLAVRETDKSVLERAGMIHVFHFDVGAVFPIALGLWTLAAGRRAGAKLSSPFWRVMGAASIAGGVILNADLVLRFSVQKYLWYRELNLVLILMAGAGLLIWLEKRSRSDLHAGYAIAGLLGILFFNNKCFAERYFVSAALPRTWEQALDWSNQNLDKDTKVLTVSALMTQLLPVYTRVKLQAGDGFPILSDVSTEDNLRRLAVLLKTLSIPKEKFIQERWYHEPGATDVPKRLRGFAPLENSLYETNWSVTMGHYAGLDKGRPYAAGHLKEMLDRVYSSAQALQEDYYVWLNNADDHLLDIGADERKDFHVVYRNAGVRIYHHVNL